MSHSVGVRTIALMLVAVLMVLAATPARTEAMDPTTIIAIASLATGGLLLIGYLIVANMEGGDKRAENGRVVWMTCSGDECNEIPGYLAAQMGAKLPDETAAVPAESTPALAGEGP